MFSASGDRKYQSSSCFLSTARKGTPFASKSRTSWPPINPPAPVTNVSCDITAPPFSRATPKGSNRIACRCWQCQFPAGCRIFLEMTTGRRSCKRHPHDTFVQTLIYTLLVWNRHGNNHNDGKNRPCAAERAHPGHRG